MEKWEAAVLVLLTVTAVFFSLHTLFSSPDRDNVAVVSGTQTATRKISLHEDGTYKIDAALPVTLQVEDGRIRFVDSVCPDHICERYGWLSKEGQQAVCMPAGVVVSIEKDASFYRTGQ